MSGRYYHTKESVDEYIKMATGFNGRKLIENLKQFLPSSSLLLEIGSGPGTDFYILKKDYRVVGSDFSIEFLDKLTSVNKQDVFLYLNAVTLKADKKFDGIYSNKVLQHLTDEELRLSIRRQFDLLNSNGIICHSFWKGEGDEIFKGLLVNYQTEDSLVSFFEKHFEILLLENYAEFENGDSILLIGKKK